MNPVIKAKLLSKAPHQKSRVSDAHGRVLASHYAPVMYTSISASSLDKLAELSMAAISRCDSKEATFSEL